jgi:class 3 adenylate cyclase/tetratricopeptide (TPR) repeat protein
MICSNCGTENRPGRRFCSQCGGPLSVACPSCGAANDPADRFCGQCGTALGTEQAEVAPQALGPVAERRLVSVLFADLVGFTALSDDRDPEEVRDLLSRYFEQSQQVVGRYGGVVEKFIGDAVMAVWGTPVAQEDDAERAVRAGLELASAVALMGEEVGEADLRARVGILTGEAAVTLGAEGQGMVAGDLVNTASRIQSVADPGSVLVGGDTRRATEAAVAYEDAGTHRMKGKDEAIQLWRATRVVGTRKGLLRARGLEAPFVGRDREMRLVKELFHASADEGRAHLVSVIGVAGVGKTRLSWEYERYIDGLAEEIWWHRGRCLAYGEGVAYWALAEMVRGRAGIVEAEEPGSALPKVRAMVEEHIPDPEERKWVEPRLAHLLGLEERSEPDQAALFSAWRLFFERLADQGPVTMIFEDLQWADTALLDFIEYLLEWSKDHPLFILTLSRPEITERRPTWGAGKRSFTSLSLEPLPAKAMEELMGGLVPGLAPEITLRILERAQGIPLYALETVRMLLDRELLERVNGDYRPTGRIEDLEVPVSLQALIAARLDGLALEERRLLQDAAVMGKTFTKPGLAALEGLDEAQVERVLTSLVRKEFLSVQADPRSPERGQYGFLQDLVRTVAYDTVSKKERKAKHLAVADHIARSWGGEEEEIVEVLASHLLEAYRAAPDAPDAEGIKSRARGMVARAGERAASLAASGEAQRYFVQAAELAEDPLEEAKLVERAGNMAWLGARSEDATELLERSRALFEALGDTHAAARVSARLGEIMWLSGRLEQAVELMESSFEVLSKDEPDADLAWLAAQLGRFLYFAGQGDTGAQRLEQALEMAESLGLPDVLSEALNSKGALIMMSYRQRPEEGFALLRHALDLALASDAWEAALRAYYNLACDYYYFERFEESVPHARDGLTLARKIGARGWEWALLSELVYIAHARGDWDDAMLRWAEIPRLEEIPATRAAAVELLMTIPLLLVARGQRDRAAELLASYASLERSSDLQESTAYHAARAAVLGSEGRWKEALESGRIAVEGRSALGPAFPGVKIGFVEAAGAALALGELDVVEELLEVPRGLGAGQKSPFWRAQTARVEAHLAAARDQSDRVDQRFAEAAALFRDTGMPFWLAVTLTEHGERLASRERTDEGAPLLAEAREIFERLKARPWIDRTSRSLPAAAPAAGG